MRNVLLGTMAAFILLSAGAALAENAQVEETGVSFSLVQSQQQSGNNLDQTSVDVDAFFAAIQIEE